MKELLAIPHAPAILEDLRFQTFAGEGSWGFKPGLASLIRRKKWNWFGAFDPHLAVGGAIVDVSYASKVFLWVYDRAEGVWLLDTTRTLGPAMVSVGDDALGSRVARGGGLEIRREGGTWQVKGRVDGLDLELTFSSQTPSMTAVCPTPVGWNVTRKQVALEVTGGISGRAVRSIDGWGLLDHSHGLMARRTSWLWAMGGGRLADGRPIGFNAISGFNDDLENAVWLGDEVFAFDRTTFHRDDQGMWRVEAPGVLDLVLDVEAIRAEDLDLKVVGSRYQQPLGVWRGTIAGQTVAVSGVAEDHSARW